MNKKKFDARIGNIYHPVATVCEGVNQQQEGRNLIHTEMCLFPLYEKITTEKSHTCHLFPPVSL